MAEKKIKDEKTDHYRQGYKDGYSHGFMDGKTAAMEQLGMTLGLQERGRP